MVNTVWIINFQLLNFVINLNVYNTRIEIQNPLSFSSFFKTKDHCICSISLNKTQKSFIHFNLITFLFQGTLKVNFQILNIKLEKRF